MGKKRIITEAGHVVNKDAAVKSTTSKKKLTYGVIAIESTYNNTKMVLSDTEGNVVFWTSSGSLGFKGAKKGTPFAASKVAEIICDQALTMGTKEIDVVVKGVGAGRESAVRTIAAKGLTINIIKDTTPTPFNGPKAAKPRRV
jgi:small subunit ribosomal protein S11